LLKKDVFHHANKATQDIIKVSTPKFSFYKNFLIN
jgi:hypothetical protein